MENPIEAYCRLVAGRPCPRIYPWWVGAALVASAVGRRVWCDPGGDNPIYPNLYLLLVGRAGVGKSQALDPAREVLERVQGVNLAPEMPTSAFFQRMIAHKAKLEDGQTNLLETREENGTRVAVQTSATVMTSEFRTFLGEDAQFWGSLARLWDCPAEHRRATIVRDAEPAIMPVTNIVAAVQPGWFRGGIPDGALSGGFMSRFMAIFSDERQMVRYSGLGSPKRAGDVAALANSLSALAQQRGPAPTPPNGPALAWANRWEAQGRPPTLPSMPGLEEYGVRRNIHLFKLALICGLARTGRPTLEVEDLELALDKMSEAEQAMPRAYEELGTSPVWPAQRAILEHLRRNGPTSETILRRLVAADLRPREFDEAMEGLVQAEQIAQTGLSYRITDDTT